MAYFVGWTSVPLRCIPAGYGKYKRRVRAPLIAELTSRLLQIGYMQKKGHEDNDTPEKKPNDGGLSTAPPIKGLNAAKRPTRPVRTARNVAG